MLDVPTMYPRLRRRKKPSVAWWLFWMVFGPPLVALAWKYWSL